MLVLILGILEKKKEFISNHKTFLVVCYTDEQIKKEQSISHRVICRELVRNIINKNIKSLTYKEMEAKLIGTPHFQEVKEEAEKNQKKTAFTRTIEDIKMTHVGHLAILLSAPTQIIFASPIVHLRAIHAIKNVFIKSEKDVSPKNELQKSALWIIDKARFAFFPHNHYHHWHVKYLAKKSIQKRNEKSEIDIIGKQFKESFPLWRSLDIDFQPFIDYLVKCNHPAQNNNYSALKEYQKLLKMLNEYNKNHKSINKNNSSENLLTEQLFSYFKDIDKPFLRPTIVKGENGKYEQSEEIKKMIRESESISNYFRAEKILPYDELILTNGLEEDDDNEMV